MASKSRALVLAPTRVAASTIGDAGFVELSDGQTLVIEGEVDLATRSWNGKIFEKV